MNRKKKINSILQKRLKKINAKAAPANKEKYISKAERAKLQLQENEQDTLSQKMTTNIE
jgi:hypothetical protein